MAETITGHGRSTGYCKLHIAIVILDRVPKRSNSPNAIQAWTLAVRLNKVPKSSAFNKCSCPGMYHHTVKKKQTRAMLP